MYCFKCKRYTHFCYKKVFNFPEPQYSICIFSNFSADIFLKYSYLASSVI